MVDKLLQCYREFSLHSYPDVWLSKLANKLKLPIDRNNFWEILAPDPNSHGASLLLLLQAYLLASWLSWSPHDALILWPHQSHLICVVAGNQ